MENQTPFDLNEAIRRWQQKFSASPSFGADNLEELASHLRASVQRLKATGLSEEAAFQIATRRLGERRALEQEFAKVNPALNLSLPGFLFCAVAGLFLMRGIRSWADFFGWIFPVSAPRRYTLFDCLCGYAVPSTPRPMLSSQLLPLHYSLFDWMGGYAMVFLLVMVLALLVIWRLTTGRWRGFAAFVVAGFEILVRTKPIRTTLSLVVLVFILTILPALGAFLADQYFTMLDLGRWMFFTGWVNVVLVVTMVLLARRGLRKNSPVAGTIENRAMSSAR